MDSADRYNHMVNDRMRQLERVAAPLDETFWARYAPGYRYDPFREPDPLLAAALAYVESGDEIIEVGGGAGRIGLPLAARAESLLNVEPSAAMREQFRIAISEHQIDNASVLASGWPVQETVQADLVLTADVTYFINDIATFLQAMNDAARRRVMILTWTVPPPNVNARLFQVAFGEAEAPSPGFKELLPVLWDLGIVPSVQVVDEPFTWREMVARNDEEAIAFAFNELGLLPDPAIADNLRPRIGDLFERGDRYAPTWRAPSQGMLITWTTT